MKKLLMVVALVASAVAVSAQGLQPRRTLEELKRVREQKAVAAAGKGDTVSGVNVVAQKLQVCDFLLNKDFKKDAKFYLCLFSASWCGPCRREMPRIAKAYAETLKDDPDIELIHFSRDQNDEKALAWAKEHDVKFPVVKPKGGNPLDLHSRGIPHLFIVDANGKLIEEGHPAKLFTDEKLRELKIANCSEGVTGKTKTLLSGKEIIDGVEWTYSIKDGKAQVDYASSSNVTGTISIPSTLGGCPVTSIGRNGNKFWFGFEWRVFEKSCNNMTSVSIPSGVVNIGNSAFFGCSNLVSVTIPASVTNIARCAFSSCGSLTSFTVDDKNPKYSSRNGLLCSKDGSTLVVGVNGDVTIPPCVKEVGSGAFSGCDNLTSVTIPDSVTNIGSHAFFNCRALKSVTIPSSVTSIGDGAFASCFNLTNVTLGNSVASIGRVAFIGRNSLTNITIPDSVTNIAYCAFSSCNNLKSVTMLGERPEAHKSIFPNCGNLKSIRVPANAKSWAGMKDWFGIPLVFDAETKK